MRSVILETMNCLSLLLFDNAICVLEEKYCMSYSFSREDNLLLKYDNSAMKIFKLSYILECQGG